MASPVLTAHLDNVAPWLTDDQSKNTRTVKSAERTLALFELFALNQRAMGVGEISKALEIPQPSVSMLVRNLSMLGYLEHDRVSRTYVPTLRIMLLGSWIHRRFSEEHDLERRLEAIVRELDESVIVGIQNGIYCQYVLAQLPERPERLEVQSGLLRPITRTAIGRVLLSLKPDAEIEAIVRRCNAEIADENLRVRPSEFMQIIEQVRHDGYARTGGDMTPGNGVIAIAIPAPTGKMPMGVGIGGLVERLAAKEQRIFAALDEFRGGRPPR
jgi:DNA-binding IclR family transcriptional regulator